MAKSRDAFRTISEVSTTLDTPAHVLRFWESKFSQIKPVKRAGGRRYYRPDDLALLAGIKDLLHHQGMTIKGAQKLLREKGVKHVVTMGHDLVSGTSALEAAPETKSISAPAQEAEKATQTEMFAKAEIAEEVIEETSAPAIERTKEPVPKPRIRITGARPVPEEPATSPAPPVALPTNPPAQNDAAPRLLTSVSRADAAKVKAKSANIAPLATRLEALAVQMRQPW